VSDQWRELVHARSKIEIVSHDELFVMFIKERCRSFRSVCKCNGFIQRLHAHPPNVNTVEKFKLQHDKGCTSTFLCQSSLSKSHHAHHTLTIQSCPYRPCLQPLTQTSTNQLYLALPGPADNHRVDNMTIRMNDHEGFKQFRIQIRRYSHSWV
jgi:hypothetical protein